MDPRLTGMSIDTGEPEGFSETRTKTIMETPLGSQKIEQEKFDSTQKSNNGKHVTEKGQRELAQSSTPEKNPVRVLKVEKKDDCHEATVPSPDKTIPKSPAPRPVSPFNLFPIRNWREMMGESTETATETPKNTHEESSNDDCEELPPKYEKSQIMQWREFRNVYIPPYMRRKTIEEKQEELKKVKEDDEKLEERLGDPTSDAAFSFFLNRTKNLNDEVEKVEGCMKDADAGPKDELLFHFIKLFARAPSKYGRRAFLQTQHKLGGPEYTFRDTFEDEAIIRIAEIAQYYKIEKLNLEFLNSDTPYFIDKLVEGVDGPLSIKTLKILNCQQINANDNGRAISKFLKKCKPGILESLEVRFQENWYSSLKEVRETTDVWKNLKSFETNNLLPVALKDCLHMNHIKGVIQEIDMLELDSLIGAFREKIPQNKTFEIKLLHGVSETLFRGHKPVRLPLILCADTWMPSVNCLLVKIEENQITGEMIDATSLSGKDSEFMKPNTC
ncbi:hypothetical protein CAEBREN_01548 [Caenorhabditis brenneri]|uniref:DUF38 domain-containing protein n=1 Tax=Caenorhabditis brenneri TaxID=135651 RepID=G0P8M1_CAEBE|nr:hypothetical protein CAEBREN_01548 [Caenorhabditis brenneri]